MRTGYGESSNPSIELKVWAKGAPNPLKKGLEQLDEYLARLGLPTGALIIFNRRHTKVPVHKRASIERAATPSGRDITLVRL